MANRRKIEAEKKWAGILRAWKSGGQTAAAYCRQAGINLYVFYRWKKRLGVGWRLKGRRGSFLPVKVVAPLAEITARPWVEVGLSNGRTIRLWREVAPECLAQMAVALETRAC